MRRSILLAALLISASLHAAQVDIAGPPGSGIFGDSVHVLPNGNIVICDPEYDEGAANIGAVRLYDGNTLSLISTLKGGSANDRVGDFGITILSNGNYVVISPDWDNTSPVRLNSGAVTWCSGVTGLNATVTAANSLIGSSSNNLVGRGALNNGAVALANGNYIVASVFFEGPGMPPDVGAVTFCNGMSGRVGVVDASNSLIGSSTNDRVGNVVLALPNGNYVVASANWDSPSPVIANAGAMTWGSGTTGMVGVITAHNSLVGSTANDMNSGNIVPLANGNYVIGLANWDRPSPPLVDVGAAVFCNGMTGRTGLISSTIALVGDSFDDRVSQSGIRALSNGNYVVASSVWDKPAPAVANVGAVTLCNGITGTTGLVTTANSLTGSTATDLVGQGSPAITALPNGNYVVASQFWNNPAPAPADVGAVTWCNGTTGRAGQIVSATNSVIGSNTNDWLSRVVALANGNYVVSSPDWDNLSPFETNVGVAALCSGITGRTGVLTSANALVGATVGDRLSDSAGVTALANGNYVVVSSRWNNTINGSNDVGAVVWCNGATGRTGEVSVANALIGSTSGDFVGVDGVTALANGNYVVGSSAWANGALHDAGAVTWCDGATGLIGAVSPANSLVGSMEEDVVGDYAIVTFPDGNYAVMSSEWNNGGIVNAGAVTFGDGGKGTVGAISTNNSIVGTINDAFDGFAAFPAYDPSRTRLVAARVAQDIVSLFTPELAPRLSIALAPAGQRTLSWSPNSAGYVLQQRTNLISGTWSNAPSGATNPATVPANSQLNFYRLIKP